MMQYNFAPAKLLVVVTAKGSSELAMKIMKKAGIPGGTSLSGRGTANYLHAFGVAEATLPEGIVFSVISKDEDSILHALIQASLERPHDLAGIAILIDVPGMFLSLNRHLEQYSQNGISQKERNAIMNSGATLVTCITNHGHADDIMAVARKAGARGGTIISARGTGTEEDVKFFGVSLAPEKEMLLIVADNEQSSSILNAVSQVPVFSEPGGGIVFTVGIERFIQLGKMN